MCLFCVFLCLGGMRENGDVKVWASSPGGDFRNVSFVHARLIYVCIYIYLYIYIETQSERENNCSGHQPNGGS